MYQSKEYQEQTQTFKTPAAGYIVVYLSNESTSLTEVYFDDLLVTVEEHPVIQKADYYPFGLAHSGGFQRVTAKQNRFLYNGKEEITDLDVNWYDYGARMYQPEIGRWHAIDPLSDKYVSFSPYNYTINNPILLIDPNGMEVDLSELNKDEKKKYKKEVRNLKQSKTFRKEYKKLKQSDRVYTVRGGKGDASFLGLSGDVDLGQGMGLITINFNKTPKEYSSEDTELMNSLGIKPDNATVGDDVLEELVHAMQYEDLIGSNNGSTDVSNIQTQGGLNNEYEAKNIRGIIKGEAGLQFTNREDENYAEKAGIKYSNKGNTNGWSNDLNTWSNMDSNPYPLRGFKSNSVQPKLLQRIVTPKKKK